jgi:hypothetical protein
MFQFPTRVDHSLIIHSLCQLFFSCHPPRTHSLTHSIIGQFAESSGEISFPEIPALVLEKVVQYLYYKVREGVEWL